MQRPVDPASGKHSPEDLRDWRYIDDEAFDSWRDPTDRLLQIWRITAMDVAVIGSILVFMAIGFLFAPTSTGPRAEHPAATTAASMAKGWPKTPSSEPQLHSALNTSAVAIGTPPDSPTARFTLAEAAGAPEGCGRSAPAPQPL
jgi:hypothetical protein